MLVSPTQPERAPQSRNYRLFSPDQRYYCIRSSTEGVLIIYDEKIKTRQRSEIIIAKYTRESSEIEGKHISQ